MGFPIPPFEWPHVGRQWPPYNIESDQADGLVAWWPTIASRGAATLRDLAGFGNHGTLVGDPTWVHTAQHGFVLDYDGAGDYVNCGSHDSISQLDALTVTAWIKRPSLGTAVFTIYCRGNLERIMELYQHKVYVGSGNNWLNTTDTIFDTLWHHVAWTFDGTANGSTVYIDGLESVSGGDDWPVNLGGVTYLAYRPDSPADEWVGCLGDCRLYDHALTAAAVAPLPDLATMWELYQVPRRIWRLTPIAPPPPTAALPIFPPPDAVHSLVFGGVTVR